MRLPRRIQRSTEAQEAIKAARASMGLAERDLDQQRAGVKASQLAIARLRAHNAANHYDLALLATMVRKGAR